MKIEADQRFYDNNYLDFVHLQYLSEIMKLVPDVVTPNDKQDRVDKYVITVDENGENPITIKGTDKDGNQTELHIKPEVTARINEVIRDNIKVFEGDANKAWSQINLIKDPTHDYFEVSAKLEDGNTLNTIIPTATTEDLKQINRVKAYPNKIEISFLEESEDGALTEVTRTYNLDDYVLKSEYDVKMSQIDNTLANIGEVNKLSDKACSYSCDNHPGKQGYCTLFEIGDTGKVLVNFAISFDTCLNSSLVAGEEWNVNCNPIDLTTDTIFTGSYNEENTIVEILYDDGTMHYVDAVTNMRQTTFTVPSDAQRGHIKKAWLRDQILFTPKI